MQENQELPPGWTWASIEELATDTLIGLVRSANDQQPTGNGVPYIKMNNVDMSGRINLDALVGVEASPEEIQRYALRQGDILFNTRNSAELVGKTGIFKSDKQNVVFNNNLMRLRFKESVVPAYVVQVLCSPDIRKRLDKVKRATTSIAAIYGKDFLPFTIPLPPIQEQRRIVAKLEELFSRLDAGVATLRQTQAQLKRYRQSVLHAAVTGELTRAWRAASPTQSRESGAALLQHIRQERKKQWEATQIAKRGGQLPLNDTWKSKYEEPAAPDTNELPDLPKGWIWANLGQLMTGILAGKSFTCLETPPQANEFGLVKISAVTWGAFNPQASKTITDPDKINLDYLIGRGDFLFSRANTLELVGACVLVQEGPRNLLLSDKVLRFDFVPNINKALILHTLRSQLGRNQIEDGSTGNQLSMRNISQDSIYKIVVPLPPLAEQAEIVAEVERRLSVLDNLEHTLTAELTRAERLRQSILHRAFTGQLVPQDPTDEPAAALLARLQVNLVSGPAAKAKRGRQPKAKQTTLAL